MLIKEDGEDIHCEEFLISLGSDSPLILISVLTPVGAVLIILIIVFVVMRIRRRRHLQQSTAHNQQSLHDDGDDDDVWSDVNLNSPGHDNNNNFFNRGFVVRSI